MSTLLILIYLSFIGLGLPDSLLGSAWPAIHTQLGAPLSAAGAVTLIISCGTVISSLCSARLIRRFGTGRITAVSTTMTALSLLGIAAAPNLRVICLLAVPLGLGAGSVDSALNNFVALHYKAQHMNWLHCFWGLGATAGPAIMALWLARQNSWRAGYGTVGGIQLALSVLLLATLPIWRRAGGDATAAQERATRTLSLPQAAAIPLAKPMFLALAFYCSAEATTGLWGASYAVDVCGVSAQTGAAWASLFYFGITVGRAAAGFLAMRLDNLQRIRLGEGLMAAGLVLLALHPAAWCVPAALFLLGLGCAPIYPAIMHQTPATFGAENSQAIMGLQMASAYVGTTLMPPLFGLLSEGIGLWLYPFYLALFVVGLTLCTQTVSRALTRRAA